MLLVAVWVGFSVRFVVLAPFWCVIAVAKKTEALQEVLKLFGILQIGKYFLPSQVAGSCAAAI
jgi:hypothetical protein